MFSSANRSLVRYYKHAWLASLSLQHFLDGFDNIIGTQSVFGQQLHGCSTLSKAVVHSYEFLRCRMEARQHLRYSVSKPTIRLMFFAGNDASGLLNGRQNRVNVKWLNSMYIDEFDTDPLSCKFGLGLYGIPNEMAARKYCDIRTLDHVVGLSDRERSVRRREDRPARSSKTQVRRADVIAESQRRQTCLVVVARNDNGHAREHPHHPDVFEY